MDQFNTQEPAPVIPSPPPSSYGSKRFFLFIIILIICGGIFVYIKFMPNQNDAIITNDSDIHAEVTKNTPVPAAENSDKQMIVESLRSMKEIVLAKDEAKLLASYSVVYKHNPDYLTMIQEGLTENREMSFEMLGQLFSGINFDTLATDMECTFLDHPAKDDFKTLANCTMIITIAPTEITEPMFEPGKKYRMKVAVVKTVGGIWYVGSPETNILQPLN